MTALCLNNVIKQRQRRFKLKDHENSRNRKHPWVLPYLQFESSIFNEYGFTLLSLISMRSLEMASRHSSFHNMFHNMMMLFLLSNQVSLKWQPVASVPSRLKYRPEHILLGLRICRRNGSALIIFFV